MDLDQLRCYVIRPALERIELWSQSSENLVLGTGLVESGFNFVDQLTPGPGPAFGPFQMEAATYRDIWVNYLGPRPTLSARVRGLAGSWAIDMPPVTELWGNFYFATAMARVLYKRVPEALPQPTDAMGMARYWKRHYNTPLGKGSEMKALQYFAQACAHHG